LRRMLARMPAGALFSRIQPSLHHHYPTYCAHGLKTIACPMELAAGGWAAGLGG
jgi:hypothetical protein